MNNYRWIIKVVIITFILSIIFGGISNLLIANMNIFVLLIVLLIIIFIGITIDVVGVSSLLSNESFFHAKATRNLKGAKESVKIIKNNANFSSICNDIVGDVCGVISGGLGAVLAINVTTQYNTNLLLTTILVSAIISAITVGGKAYGKIFASKKSNIIIEKVGILFYYVSRKKK